MHQEIFYSKVISPLGGVLIGVYNSVFNSCVEVKALTFKKTF